MGVFCSVDANPSALHMVNCQVFNVTTGGDPANMVLIPTYLYSPSVHTLPTAQTSTFSVNITLFYGLNDYTWNTTLSYGKSHYFYTSSTSASSSVTLNGATNNGIQSATRLASSNVLVNTSTCFESFKSYVNDGL